MAGAKSPIQAIRERQPAPEENEGRRQALARGSGELELTVPSKSIGDMEPDEDFPCRCGRIDVDVDDARDCPLHGPASEAARLRTSVKRTIWLRSMRRVRSLRNRGEACVGD
jgi:hypothetical protein